MRAPRSQRPARASMRTASVSAYGRRDRTKPGGEHSDMPLDSQHFLRFSIGHEIIFFREERNRRQVEGTCTFLPTLVAVSSAWEWQLSCRPLSLRIPLLL